MRILEVIDIDIVIYMKKKDKFSTNVLRNMKTYLVDYIKHVDNKNKVLTNNDLVEHLNKFHYIGK